MARVVNLTAALVGLIVASLVANVGSIAAASASRNEAAPSFVVFVGTVGSTAGSGLWADIDVDEVWQGSVPEHVTLAGGPLHGDGKPFALAQTRTYEKGARYVFFSLVSAPDTTPTLWGRYTDGDSPRYEDASSSNTHPYDPSVDDEARPPSVKPPTPGSELVRPPGAPPPSALLIGGVIAVLLALGSITLLVGQRRARRAASGSGPPPPPPPASWPPATWPSPPPPESTDNR